jgi:hypothetical protein
VHSTRGTAQSRMEKRERALELTSSEQWTPSQPVRSDCSDVIRNCFWTARGAAMASASRRWRGGGYTMLVVSAQSYGTINDAIELDTVVPLSESVDLDGARTVQVGVDEPR